MKVGALLTNANTVTIIFVMDIWQNTLYITMGSLFSCIQFWLSIFFGNHYLFYILPILPSDRDTPNFSSGTEK